MLSPASESDPSPRKTSLHSVQTPPESSSRSPVWLRSLLLFYMAFLGGLFLSNRVGPERWWFGSLNLYLPQWLWGMPALVLVPMAFIWARRLIWLPLLCLLGVLGPLMGFCWPAGGSAPSPGNHPSNTRRPRSLRVMTFNVKWMRLDGAAAIRELDRARPDLVLFQDANGTLVTQEELAAWFRGWHIRSIGQYLVAAKMPLSDAETSLFPLPQAADGPYLNYFRCRLQLDGQMVTVYNLHLLTPRQGLVAVRHEGQEGMDALSSNTTIRLAQAQMVANAVRSEKGPVLLTGDLNAPMPSLVCQELEKARMRDAFNAAGRGYGYTYGHMLRTRHSYVRIDHIFVSSHWQVKRCWAGGKDASEHRPVIADLVLSD